MKSVSKNPLVADSDGYYEVVLSYYGMPSRNGNCFAPIHQTAIDKFNARGGVCGEIEPPRKRIAENALAALEIENASTAFWIKSIRARPVDCLSPEGKSVQEITAFIKPMGPYGPELMKRFADPHAFLSFGIRAATLHKRNKEGVSILVESIITWDVLGVDNYPDLIVHDDNPNPSNESYGVNWDSEFGDYHVMDPTNGDLSLFNTKSREAAFSVVEHLNIGMGYPYGSGGNVIYSATRVGRSHLEIARVSDHPSLSDNSAVKLLLSHLNRPSRLLNEKVVQGTKAATEKFYRDRLIELTKVLREKQRQHLDNHQGDVYHLCQSLAVRYGLEENPIPLIEAVPSSETPPTQTE